MLSFVNWVLGFALARSDSRFSCVDNLLPGSVPGSSIPSSVHLFVNPFPPPALPGLIGTVG